MGHDVHFLQRVGDRAHGGDIDFLLGLYRDHEFVRYLLAELKVGPDVAAVALAVADDGPYAIVARSGHFVTCLDKGMHLKDALLVPRGKIDALFAKDQKMRERRALAVERGLDDQRAIAKLETMGPALAREDFVATAGLLGPATTVLTETYATCAFQIADLMPHLMRRDLDPKLRRDWHRQLAQNVWWKRSSRSAGSRSSLARVIVGAIPVPLAVGTGSS